MTNSFDKEIREKLADYEPEVPSHLWENIAAKNKKKRPFFWILFTDKKYRMLPIAVLALGISGTFVKWYRTSAKSGDRKEIRLAENKNIAGLSEISPNKTSFAATNINSSSSDNREAHEEKKISEKPVTHDATIETNGNMINSISHKKSMQALSSVGERTYQKSSYNAIAKVVEKEEPNNLISAVSKNEKNNWRLKGNPNNPNIRQATKDIGNASSLSTDEKMSENKEYLLSQAPIHFSAAPGRRVASLPSLILKSHAVGIPCPEANASGNKRYFEFYAGPDKVFSCLRDTANSDYLAKRKETTEMAFAFSAGMRYTRVFSNSVNIRAALNYSHIIENFKLSEGNVIQVIYITNANGDTIGNYSSSGTRYSTSQNHYRTLDIPVTMGYELGNGNLHTNISIGLIANIYSWQKARTIDPSEKAIDISTGAAPSPYQFKTNIGIGFIGSATFYYKLNENLHVFGEPYLRYNLSTVNKEHITLKQKFHTSGIRLGIRYDLKKSL